MLVFRRIFLILLRDYLVLYQMVTLCVVIALSAIIHQKIIYFVIQEPVKNIELILLLPVSKHVVYLIWCPCGLGYVGKTSRQLKQRISEHKSSIRRKDVNYPVVAHFLALNHDVSTLQFCGIERVNVPPRGGDIEVLLQQRELFWIFTLQTLSPNGMNDEALFNAML